MERVWVWGTGGPHLLMEKRLIGLWEADAGTEERGLYHKTEEVDGAYITEMALGDGSCIVISEEGPSTWVSNENGDGGILVVSIYVEEGIDEERFLESLGKIPDDRYSETGIGYRVFDDRSYLFPACDLKPGYSEPYYQVDLIPGVYQIKMIEEYGSDDGSFILFKFTRL